jgi:hypothetical protein
MLVCVPLPGKLASVLPSRVVPQLAEMAQSSNPHTRWTAVTAVRFAVASVSTRKELRASVVAFLELLTDDSLPVRLAALVTVNALVHVEAVLVQHLVLPVLVSTEERVSEPAPPAVCDGVWREALRH